MKFVKLYRKFWKITLLLFVFVSWLIVLNRNQSLIYKFLYSNRLVPTKDRFTELYFENDQKLPKFIEPYKEERIQFTIHNLEGMDEEYLYEMVYVGANTKRVIQGGRILVKNDERKTIDIPLLFPQVVTGTIHIILPDKNQAIHMVIKEKKK